MFGSHRAGRWGLYQKPSDGGGNEEPLIQSDGPTAPMSWSPDGRSIMYWARTQSDLWVLPLVGDRKAAPLMTTPFDEPAGEISPDGKWFAYDSHETSRREVYVRPFPAGAGKWQVSTSGGFFPRWRRDGQELFYLDAESGGKLMAVDIKISGFKFEVGTPKALFDSGYITLAHPGGPSFHAFAVSADGQRFLIPRPALRAREDAESTPIVVVVNWAAALRD